MVLSTIRCLFGINLQRITRFDKIINMRKVSKPYQQRREELRQSLYRLDGAVERYKENAETAELDTIAIELRGLVVADGGLLLSLSEEKGFPLEFWTYSPVFTRSDTPFPIKYIKVWEPAPFALTSEPPWTEKVSVQECLDRPVAEIKGSTFNVKRLITEIASSFGPAHYDEKISAAIVEMKEDIIGGVPSHFATLLNLAEVISKLQTSGHRAWAMLIINVAFRFLRCNLCVGLNEPDSISQDTKAPFMSDVCAPF